MTDLPKPPPVTRRAFLTQAAGGLAGIALIPEFAKARTPASWAGRDDHEAMDVALIGLGKQGRAIIGELSAIEHANLVAVCDIDERRLNAAKRRAASAERFASVDALLAERPEIIAYIIATPTHTHRPLVEQLCAAGKHVYCEAPLATNLEDCTAIVRAGAAGSGIAGAGLYARANPVYNRAWELVRSGGVEDILTLRAQRHERTSWRVPGGSPDRDRALNWRLDPDRTIGLAGEWGTHQFDVAMWMLDKAPTSVRAHGGVRAYDDGRTVYDTVTTDLFFDDLLFQHSATLGSTHGRTQESVIGTAGTVRLAGTHAWFFKEADAPTMGWEVYATRQQFHNDEGIILIADATKLASQGKLKEGIGLPHSPLYYALSDWLAAAIDGYPSATSLEDAARATAAGIAAHQASVTGETVDVVMPKV